jgi:putative effector of murein hydrolase
MSNLQTFLASIGVSVLVSTVVLFTILRPLRRVLSMMCRSGEALPFWLNFTIVMLYAVPLFFAVLWTPYNSDLTSIMRIALAASLFGTIGGLGIIGLNVSGKKPN